MKYITYTIIASMLIQALHGFSESGTSQLPITSPVECWEREDTGSLETTTIPGIACPDFIATDQEIRSWIDSVWEAAECQGLVTPQGTVPFVLYDGNMKLLEESNIESIPVLIPNYRVGFFGYMKHGERILAAALGGIQQEASTSGGILCYLYQDQVAALVRDYPAHILQLVPCHEYGDVNRRVDGFVFSMPYSLEAMPYPLYFHSFMEAIEIVEMYVGNDFAEFLLESSGVKTWMSIWT